MSNAFSTREEGGKSSSNTFRMLPDFDVCRSQHAGYGKLVSCLVDDPYECEYALEFSNHFFCCNPARVNFTK
jgi:hypothetical protein